MRKVAVEAEQLLNGDGRFVGHGSALHEGSDHTGEDLDGAIDPDGDAAVGVERFVVLWRWREVDDRNCQAVRSNSNGHDLGDMVQHGDRLSVLPAY